MTEAATVPLPSAKPLQPLGDPMAAGCVGDSCAIADSATQAEVNRKLDDAV